MEKTIRTNDDVILHAYVDMDKEIWILARNRDIKLTPSQARELANALIQAADEIEYSGKTGELK